MHQNYHANTKCQNSLIIKLSRSLFFNNFIPIYSVMKKYQNLFLENTYLIKVISVQTGWKYARVILKKRANDITETEKTEISDFSRVTLLPAHVTHDTSSVTILVTSCIASPSSSLPAIQRSLRAFSRQIL